MTRRFCFCFSCLCWPGLLWEINGSLPKKFLKKTFFSHAYNIAISARNGNFSFRGKSTNFQPKKEHWGFQRRINFVILKLFITLNICNKQKTFVLHTDRIGIIAKRLWWTAKKKKETKRSTSFLFLRTTVWALFLVLHLLAVAPRAIHETEK